MRDAQRHDRHAEALLAFADGSGAEPCGPVLVVAAHPDDEVIGAGILLARLSAVHVPIHLVHVTDGSPRSLHDARHFGFSDAVSYARQRRLELRRALEVGGIAVAGEHVVGVPDQEASMLLERVAACMRRILRLTRPRVVLTHAYEGGHPDHDSTAFVVQSTLSLDGPDERPGLVEFTSYNGVGGLFRAEQFLPGPEPTRTLHLSAEERTLKARMLEAFTTQQRTLAQFPLHVERFRRAPTYDFTAPPHEGRLYYEHFDWGIDGASWRARARTAQRALAENEVWT